MGHFYDVNGLPHHYVPYKDKARQGLYRDTTLRDARPNWWFQSVTTVLGMLDKPALFKWSMKRAIREALSRPTYGKVELEDEISNVIKKADEYRNWTAEFGSRVHEQMAHLWTGEVTEIIEDELDHMLAEIIPFPLLDQYQDYTLVNPVAEATYEWMLQKGFSCIQAEQVFVNLKWGYAGTTDLVALYEDDICIVDIKTQDADEVGDFNFWDEWPLQDAAYDLGLFDDGVQEYERHRRINVVTSRTKPGLVTMKEWSDNEIEDRKWLLLLEYWMLDKKYDPREGYKAQQVKLI